MKNRLEVSWGEWSSSDPSGESPDGTGQWPVLPIIKLGHNPSPVPTRAKKAEIPSLTGLQVVVCGRWFGAEKGRFASIFCTKTCRCTPLLRKAKPNWPSRMLLIANFLHSILGVKSLASFGNSAFLRLEHSRDHKRMVNFE
jgi:hypothetical protein